MRDFIEQLPKPELHVHLVGSASLDTVLELARRHPDQDVPTERERLRAFYEFTDFAHFIDVYVKVTSLVVTGADITALAVGLARDLAANRVRYAEVTVTPVPHVMLGIEPDELAEALTTGRRLGWEQHRVELAWVFDIAGSLGYAAGVQTAEWVLRYRPEGTVGFGLGGNEVGVPRERYQVPFDMARDGGLHLVPHAGETTGPKTIWSALLNLHAERIGHGTSAVRDPNLLAHLAGEGIPLEVCPSSNIRTRAVATLAEHPLPRLLDAGVPVTLATDDPGMFHTDLNREYLLVHEQFGLSRGELADLARTGVRASFREPDRTTALLAEIDAVERQYDTEGRRTHDG
ncbi:adenosine deaminase [Actinophytocola oryzae]|uniref:Aminodeoxyfutalosine deaminase n=1 Tax=Actinophytocola oryzae TaxID=502181 RepID=A0A4R7UW93_9PSEU|nr:adenosine deaminase [Actinophytocola oryzae]TDV40334.1 aminodeoxyfutalosine deaminase [Actinophytocola oryzae]